MLFLWRISYSGLSRVWTVDRIMAETPRESLHGLKVVSFESRRANDARNSPQREPGGGRAFAANRSRQIRLADSHDWRGHADAQSGAPHPISSGQNCSSAKENSACRARSKTGGGAQR